MTGSLQILPHVRSMIDTDGALLLDLKEGKYFSLNTVGAQIWVKAQEGLTLPEILSHLQTNFQVPVERLQLDLTKYVSGLEKKGLVHVLD